MTELKPRNCSYPAFTVLISNLLELASLPLLAVCPRPRGDVQRILLVEPFALGDAVLLAVMFAPLKARYPEAEIHLLIQPMAAEVFSHDSRVAKIHTFRFPWAGRTKKYRIWAYPWGEMRALRQQLRHEQFDIGIDTRGEIRSQMLLCLAGCRQRLGFTNYLGTNVRIRGRLLTGSLGAVPTAHRVRINLDLCKLAGCDIAGQPRLPALEWRTGQPASSGYILLHPGGGSSLKWWPPERWAQVIDHLQISRQRRVMLVVGPSEQELLDGITRHTRSAVQAHTPESLRTLVDLISACDFFVGLDSGPMNIASMLGKRALALFGPGVVELFYPAVPGSRWIHHQEGLACAPCQAVRCVQDSNLCMQRIPVNEVIAALDQML